MNLQYGTHYTPSLMSTGFELFPYVFLQTFFLLFPVLHDPVFWNTRKCHLSYCDGLGTLQVQMIAEAWILRLLKLRVFLVEPRVFVKTPVTVKPELSRFKGKVAAKKPNKKIKKIVRQQYSKRAKDPIWINWQTFFCQVFRVYEDICKQRVFLVIYNADTMSAHTLAALSLGYAET